MHRLALAAVSLCACNSLLGIEDVTPAGDGGVAAAVTVASARTRVVRGDTAMVELMITRDASITGEVAISADNPPAGAVVAPLVIAAGASTGTLEITTADPLSFGLVSIGLTAEADGDDSSATIALFVADLPGRLDTTFGGDGEVELDATIADDVALALAVQPDGKIVAVGGGGNQWYLARFDSDGAVNTSFGADGVVEGNPLGILNGVAIDSDGKVVVCGTLFDAGATDQAFVARFLANGDPDEAFAAVGRFVEPNESHCNGVVIDDDGGILFAGDIEGEAAVWRRTSSGATDTGFGENGIGRRNLNGSPSMLAIARAPDDKVVTAGRSLGNDYYLSRLTANAGNPDSTFNGGIVIVDAGGADADVSRGVVAQPDGKVIVAGSSGVLLSLARVGPTGTIDGNFGNSGVRTDDIANSAADRYFAATLQADGKIVAVGWGDVGGASNNAVVARYIDNSDSDAGFGDAGFVIRPADELHAVAIDADGRLIAAGKNNGGDLMVIRLWD